MSDAGNNRVEKFGPFGGFIETFGSSGTGQGQFKETGDVAITPALGELFVTDAGNNRVEKWDSTTPPAFASTIGAGDFSRPGDAAIDAKGRVWVTNSKGNPGWSEIGQAVGVGLVCVATDGAGCVAAGLADLDANVVSNDYEAVAESCRAGEEESSSLTDLAGFALGAGVGGLADGSLSEEAKKALESTSAGQAALKQLVGLGAGSSALTTLAYAQGHESSGSSCSCGG